MTPSWRCRRALPARGEAAFSVSRVKRPPRLRLQFPFPQMELESLGFLCSYRLSNLKLFQNYIAPRLQKSQVTLMSANCLISIFAS